MTYASFGVFRAAVAQASQQAVVPEPEFSGLNLSYIGN